MLPESLPGGICCHVMVVMCVNTLSEKIGGEGELELLQAHTHTRTLEDNTQ